MFNKKANFRRSLGLKTVLENTPKPHWYKDGGVDRWIELCSSPNTTPLRRAEYLYLLREARKTLPWGAPEIEVLHDRASLMVKIQKHLAEYFR